MELPKLGIVIALAPEARVLPGKLIRRFHESLSGKKGHLASGKNFICVISGMGKRAAEKGAACVLRQDGVSVILSIGVSGALHSSMKVGDIVLAQKIVTINGSTCVCDNSLNDSIEKNFANAGVLFKKGILLSTDNVLGDRPSKSEAHTRTRACAVDMESMWVGQAAQNHCIPFTSIRVISDTRDQVIPFDVTGLISSKGKVDGKAVMKTLLNQPSVVFDLPQMALYFKRALKSLRYAVRAL